MSDAALQQLIDRAAISDTVYAYATGLDRGDWELYRSIFTPRIEMDFESTGIRAGTYDADRWVRDAKRLFAGFSATQHSSTNHVHELRGDEATCISNMQAEHFVPADGEVAADETCWTIGGYYENGLVRTDAGWKLCRVTLHVTWSRGNRRVLSLALARGRAASG